MPRLVLAAVVLAVAGCDTAGLDPLSPEVIELASLSQDPAALVGTWDWVASVGAFRQSDVMTPASTGRTHAWTFRADGTATRLENGEVVLETTYRVERRTYGPDDADERVSLQFGYGGYGEDFGTRDDLLVLDSRPVDGPQARYRRR